MKGRRQFSKVQELEIRRLLALKVNAERNKQKYLRQQLRDMGFYISDYNSHFNNKSNQGFSLTDFDLLKRMGIIKISH